MAAKAVVIRDSLGAELRGLAPVKMPLGGTIAHSRTGQNFVLNDSSIFVGIWEWTLGTFNREVMSNVFCHIVSGWCFYTPEGGETVELRAGDAIFLPENVAGIWDVREQLRKTYVIF